MNIHKRNDVSIYCLSSGPTLPEWLGDRAKRNLSKRDENIRRRIELIQDFQMPSSSSKIVQSADGRYIFVAGTYPPRIKCFDVHDLSMKFERYVDAHIVDMVMLGEDYGKLALLREDRTIDFHAPYGAHENIRIPSFGRAMAYESTTCELLVAAKGQRVYRLNLEEGRFSEPWKIEETTTDDGCSSSSCISVAPSHPLAAVGCDDGIVRFWDNRTPDALLKPFLQLNVHAATAGRGFADQNSMYTNIKEISSLAFDPNSLYLGCGTAGGLAIVYDIRSSRPLSVVEHKNGTPILNMKFHGSGNILSMDEKLVKAWCYKSATGSTRGINGSGADSGGVGGVGSNAAASVVVNVEGSGKLEDFIMAGDEKDPQGYNSGVLLCACDQPKVESYYIPKIGLAPTWCSFLENITEELEETDLARKGGDNSGLVRDGNETIYENYKFVSRDDVEELGITNLIGTPMLRGYMHGFFMDINLYNRVKAVANPFAYEDYRKKKLKERLEAKRSSRIAPKKDANNKRSKTNVNPDLADRLKERAESDTKAGKVANKLLGDDRFGSLFTDPAFQIDEEDENFKLRNPSGVAASKRQKNDLDSDDDASEEGPSGQISDADDDDDDEEEMSGTDVESDDGSDDDGFRGGKVRAEEYETMKSLTRKSKRAQVEPKRVKKRVVYEATDLEGISSGDKTVEALHSKKIDKMAIPLSKRVALQKDSSDDHITQIKGKFGAKELTYLPKSSRKSGKEDDGEDRKTTPKRQKRGIKELGLRRQPNF